MIPGIENVLWDWERFLGFRPFTRTQTVFHTIALPSWPIPLSLSPNSFPDHNSHQSIYFCIHAEVFPVIQSKHWSSKFVKRTMIYRTQLVLHMSQVLASFDLTFAFFWDIIIFPFLEKSTQLKTPQKPFPPVETEPSGWDRFFPFRTILRFLGLSTFLPLNVSWLCQQHGLFYVFFELEWAQKIQMPQSLSNIHESLNSSCDIFPDVSG